MPKRNGLIDLHMHTSVSDGTDSPEELLQAVRSAGISVFSVTDHDAVKAGTVIRGLLQRNADVTFIPGVEFSCQDEDGKYHILGYGFDPEGEAIRRVVDEGHAIRMNKLGIRLDFIRREFGFVFPDEEIDALRRLDNPGKPHIGNLMVKYGYAGNRSEAIEKYLNDPRLENEHVLPRTAIEGILDGGGVPVLAHPFFGSGDELILGEDMEKRLKKLMGDGVQGIEAFYSGFTDKLRAAALRLAAENGLYVTAGSDYHGKNKIVRLAQNGLAEYGEYPQGMRRFLGRFGIES